MTTNYLLNGMIPPGAFFLRNKLSYFTLVTVFWVHLVATPPWIPNKKGREESSTPWVYGQLLRQAAAVRIFSGGMFLLGENSMHWVWGGVEMVIWNFCEYEDRRTHTAHHVTPCWTSIIGCNVYSEISKRSGKTLLCLICIIVAVIFFDILVIYATGGWGALYLGLLTMADQAKGVL